MKIQVNEIERMMYGDTPNSCRHADDAIKAAKEFGYDDWREVTGAMYDDSCSVLDNRVMYVSVSDVPYTTSSSWVKLEQVTLPDWYQGRQGSNDYVVRVWFFGGQAHNRHNSFHTDGKSIYSYQMKIGRKRLGHYEILDAYGYSRTTTRHIQVVRAVMRDINVPITTVNPVRASSSRDVLGKGWLTFPSETHFMLKDYKPGLRVMAKQTEGTKEGFIEEGSKGVVCSIDPHSVINMVVDFDGKGRHSLSHRGLTIIQE